jgi:F420 biosynthesis protein FbiB-like protein
MVPNSVTAKIDHEGLAQARRLLEARYSVRRYAAVAIGDEVIEQLLYCATRAPSAHNRQPWRFVVLREAAAKTCLGSAMGERLRRDRLMDGDEPMTVAADVQRSFDRITKAPVVVLVACSLQDMDSYPDPKRRSAEAAMAMQSTAMAVQNLLLAATAAGLGACWICAPLFCPEVARDVLQLPADWQPQALVTIGVPDGPGRRRARRPLHEVVRD